MSDTHVHHFPRFAPGGSLAHTRQQLREVVAQARPWQRFVAVATIAALSGLCIGVAMPRGPVTSGEALALLIVGVVVGFCSGLILRSRWAMLLAPVAQIVVFELARLGASGPTVDGISLDGLFGPHAFIVGRGFYGIVGRGFYGIVGVLPMVVAAAHGAAVARRSELKPQRRLHSRIGLHFRRGVTAIAALAVLALVYLLATPASVPPIRDASGRVVPGSIASFEKVPINGNQWIEIPAWSPDKPVLLSIPGGPGQSDLAMSRPTLGTLAKDFVVVSWDQRGIGKSYASYDPKTLTTKQAVADTIGLTNYLRQRFDERKIYLFGESGGSIIGRITIVHENRVSSRATSARRLLELAPQVPTPVWGRDELGTGEMWNSNSTVSWLLASSGLDVESIPLPHGGRAPGWKAGIAIAHRQQAVGSGDDARDEVTSGGTMPESNHPF